MEAVGIVGIEKQSAPSDPLRDAALDSLFGKILSGGDLAAECLLLLSEDNAQQMKINCQGVRIQRKAQMAARRKKIKLMQERMRAKRDEGFFSRLANKIKKATEVLTNVLGFFLPPVAGAVYLGGSALAYGCEVPAADYRRKADRLYADMVKTDSDIEANQNMHDEVLQSLEDVVHAEQRMVARILDFAEGEQKGVVI